MPKLVWTLDSALAFARENAKGRYDLQKKSNRAYVLLLKAGLLDDLFSKKTPLPSPKNKREKNGDYRKGLSWSEDMVVLAEGRKYSSRTEFNRANGSAYRVARERSLLDQLYPNQKHKWFDKEVVLAEANKYSSRVAFMRGSGAAYHQARRNGWLELIDWPENNAPSDNDAIYIWRAKGVSHNGNPVYKIGVTSARLGIVRVQQVSRESGFEFDLICCEPVQCKASDLEKKLHILGENPGYTGFDGCTEFRAMSDSALYAAVSIICSAI